MMYATSLYYPDIMMGLRCEDCVTWMQMPKKRRIRPDAREEPDISLLVHPTSEVLSQKRNVWIFARLDVRRSISSQLRSIPASSRSLMIRVPALNSSFTLCGDYYCQMIGPILFRPYFHTPPCDNSTTI